MDELVLPNNLEGIISSVPSKSDSQRAILAASLTNGRSTIYNIGDSDDVLAMLRSIECLGAEIKKTTADSIEINRISEFPKNCELNIGESGLGLRLLVCMCAVHNGDHTINGEGTLNSRSHSFFEEYLNSHGAQITSNKGSLPIRIQGVLKGGSMKVDGSQSSQYISGLLMALPLLETNTVLTVENLTSVPYVEMTLATLSAFGIKIDHDNLGTFYIQGNQGYKATNYHVEGDWSSASCWLVASALGHKVQVSGLNLNSKQADKALFMAFENANCKVLKDTDMLTIDGSKRKAFEFDARHCPDLFPALVLLALFCEGRSKIQGVERLRNKESDRASVIQSELTKIGAHISIKGDFLVVEGGKLLHGSTVDSNDDHRIAMMLAIVGTMIEGGVTIQKADAVTKSYPEFWSDFNSLIQ